MPFGSQQYYLADGTHVLSAPGYIQVMSHRCHDQIGIMRGAAKPLLDLEFQSGRYLTLGAKRLQRSLVYRPYTV